MNNGEYSGESSRLLLQNLERAVQQNGGAITSEHIVALSEGAQATLDAAMQSQDKMFAFAEERIRQQRAALDMMEELVKQKREAVFRSMQDFVRTLEVVAHDTDAMQEHISNLVLATDKL